ncbi:MAG: flagellin FliC5, partial [Lachnospiraceae bacterium]|nr:flagellin FliC5 [Lachnospiraceae bacterium]
MSGIAGVRTDYYNQIASGVRLQSAADGAAQMSIVQREKAQINGYDMGTRNARDGRSLLDVADGAYQGITESLQRMRELAVQASNTATVSDG